MYNNAYESTTKTINFSTQPILLSRWWAAFWSLNMRVPNKGSFKKGHKPWNDKLKGIHLSPSSEFKKGVVVNENHPQWTGDDVKYHAVHRWIGRHYKKSISCDHCGTVSSKRLEWANVSKQYTRDRDDWLTLCTSCHIKYDRLPERKAIQMRVKP